MRGFLYGQTEYTLLNNAIHLDEYVAMAKSSGFDFLTITDVNMYGHYKFYKACIQNNIKPIIGLEVSIRDMDGYISKYLLYAKNHEGYKALIKLSSMVSTNKDISLNELLDYQECLVIILVFNGSYLDRYIQSNSIELLSGLLSNMGNIYIGYSLTNRLDKLSSNKKIIELAKASGAKTVPVHQCCYLEPNDFMVYEAITLIAGNSVNVQEYEDYSFPKQPISDASLDEIISSINLDLFNERIALPKYPNTKGATSKEFLDALCYKGLQKRLGKPSPVYHNRLAYELSVIDKMGYNDYFLIVWDFIKYAKSNNILVGPGRGSAAGSLVSYCLGITEVDPIKYDLLFERFLNPERISMPDIDTDFPDIYRDDVINHVKNVYGKNHVCNISAYSTFLIKSSFRDLGRVYKVEASRIDELIKMVEHNGYDKVLLQVKDRDDVYRLVYIAKRLDGMIRHVSTHAAGIILSSAPLDEVIPVQDGINDLYQSQLEAQDLEKIGLLKMDFLGIRNLTIVDEIMREIPGFDTKKLREIPLNDKKTFELLQKGDTLGIFQLESDGIRRVLTKLVPTSFEDLVATLALYRPGPMDNIDEFIRRKHTNDHQYPHKILEPILKSTYGIIVYQEQIMKIAQAFAGYSLGEADILRRAVSKKDAHALSELSNDFISRAINNGYSANIARDIYELILKFANYGFNRSHSVAYGILSYQMAYFKANYFNIFMSKILNNVIGSTSTLVGYLEYSKAHGLIISKPSINISSYKFVSDKNVLYIPFNAIKSIGDVVAKSITDERINNGPYKSFDNFKLRHQSLSSAVIEALIYAGAFDEFGKTKKSLIDNSSVQDSIFNKHLDDVIVSTSEYPIATLKEKELEYLGLNIEYNIFKDIQRKYKENKAVPFNTFKLNGQGVTILTLTNIKEIKTKTNEIMLVGNANNDAFTMRFVCFASDYVKLKPIISENILFAAVASKSLSNKNEEQLVIKNLKKL